MNYNNFTTFGRDKILIILIPPPLTLIKNAENFIHKYK